MTTRYSITIPHLDGHPPEYVFEWQRNLWLGPIETNQMIER